MGIPSNVKQNENSCRCQFVAFAAIGDMDAIRIHVPRRKHKVLKNTLVCTRVNVDILKHAIAPSTLIRRVNSVLGRMRTKMLDLQLPCV
ncbi:hypothetical protein POVWA2_011560 [Plasmodium ovale wallikeri]|uniref:Uncharacterized protein n=1 Tax=Plasmodium ovale wallikeri TaxID=864142 RepID=A0A1A8YML1_PLAOA|nr:hypothetical protein POVWA2_011560 [Plasmodium ovale wallikeri]